MHSWYGAVTNADWWTGMDETPPVTQPFIDWTVRGRG